MLCRCGARDRLPAPPCGREVSVRLGASGLARRQQATAATALPRPHTPHGAPLTLATSGQPLSFTVPRKSDTGNEDLYPDTLAGRPALSSAEWLAGKNALPVLTALAEAGESKNKRWYLRRRKGGKGGGGERGVGQGSHPPSGWLAAAARAWMPRVEHSSLLRRLASAACLCCSAPAPAPLICSCIRSPLRDIPAGKFNTFVLPSADANAASPSPAAVDAPKAAPREAAPLQDLAGASCAENSGKPDAEPVADKAAASVGAQPSKGAGASSLATLQLRLEGVGDEGVSVTGESQRGGKMRGLLGGKREEAAGVA